MWLVLFGVYALRMWCVYSPSVCAVYEFCVCVCVCMFLVSVGILRIGALCMLYVYMYCILDKRVLDVWCVCDKCVVCGEHMHLICVVFIGVVHLNWVCGVCDVGDICVAHVWCVCVSMCHVVW